MHRALWRLCANDTLKNGTHMLYVSSSAHFLACLSHETSLTKPKVQKKLLRISKQWQKIIKANVGQFCNFFYISIYIWFEAWSYSHSAVKYLFFFIALSSCWAIPWLNNKCAVTNQRQTSKKSDVMNLRKR